MHFYNFADFCVMIAEEKRSRGYVEALRAAVKPGSVVLDIGAGTGFFSILACRFGASKVYAIEPNPLVHLGKQFAAENGCADRIGFIQGLSTEFIADEPADVLICDLRGTTPLLGAGIASIIDARKRLLKPEAVIIARRDTISFALAEAAEIYETNISRYVRPMHGVSLAAGKRFLTNRALSPKDADVRVRSEARTFAAIDYLTVEETSFRSTMSWTVETKGTLHGLLGWFESDLGFGQTAGNAPGSGDATYGLHFLPFDEPLRTDAGDRVEAAVAADFDGQGYNWSWSTARFAEGSPEPAEQMAQTMHFANYVPPSEILKHSEYFQPQPNADAGINLLFLQMQNGENLLGDIADAMLERFPERFRGFDEALAAAAMLAKSYSK